MRRLFGHPDEKPEPRQFILRGRGWSYDPDKCGWCFKGTLMLPDEVLRMKADYVVKVLL